MIDLLNDALTHLSTFLWGWPLLILLLGTHLYLTIRLRFPQRYILTALKMYFSKDEADKEGDISQFSALMIALAATVGTGNIIGVALAITIGGPGAIFWCWITGILGMATRYGEGLLSIRYRVKNSHGEMVGGPMYVLRQGLGLKSLGVIFAILTAIAAFGIGNVTQGNAAATLLQETWSIPTWVTASVLTLLTAVVMLGGIKSIGRACACLVPFMAICYILGCLVILATQYEYVGPAIETIIESAFRGNAVVGGFAGSTLIAAMRAGVSRGLFSNEAGLGSAPIASAAAKTANPIRQALISSTGPFWDTVVICALTGLVITTSVLAHPDISFDNGKSLTFDAFSKIPFGIGTPILSLSLLTFVISTVLGWSYFGEKAMEFLCGKKAIFPYRLVWVAAVYFGCVAKVDLVWNFADCANALMCIPNLISLIFLSGVIVTETKYYLWGNRINEHDDREPSALID